MTTMRISQFAERSGIPAATLRFYESCGLLPADRPDAGYQLSDEETARRLVFSYAGKHLGPPLEEIGELLAVWESGACAQVKIDPRPRSANRVAADERRADELAAFIATLYGALNHLHAQPDRAEPCDARFAFLTAALAPSVAPAAVDVPLITDRQFATADAERWRTAPVACGGLSSIPELTNYEAAGFRPSAAFVAQQAASLVVATLIARTNGLAPQAVRRIEYDSRFGPR